MSLSTFCLENLKTEKDRDRYACITIFWRNQLSCKPLAKIKTILINAMWLNSVSRWQQRRRRLVNLPSHLPIVQKRELKGNLHSAATLVQTFSVFLRVRKYSAIATTMTTITIPPTAYGRMSKTGAA